MYVFFINPKSIISELSKKYWKTFPKNLGRPFQKFFGRPSAAGPTKHLYDPPIHLHRHPI